jgi:hypothetical protein
MALPTKPKISSASSPRDSTVTQCDAASVLWVGLMVKTNAMKKGE